MTEREAGDDAPGLRLASANPQRDIDIHHARRRAARKLANLAATILRTVAGSSSPAPIMQNAIDYLDAQRQLLALTGGPLTQEDEAQALGLSGARLSSNSSETRSREFQYTLGIEKIVRGALRSAAHQVLEEREHFGGKYSTLAIEEGISLVLRAKKGPRTPNRRKVIL